MKKSKKVWAWLLTLAMVVTLMPSTTLIKADSTQYEANEGSGDLDDSEVMEEDSEEPIIYEAEDDTVCTLTKVSDANSRIRYDLSNASGGAGATVYPTDYLTFRISVEKAGTYTVKVNYAANSYPAGTAVTYIPVEVTVGDGDPATYTLTNNKNYNSFTEYDLVLELEAETNTVKIENACTEDSTVFVNIDYISVYPYTNAEGRHEAEDANSYTQGSASDAYSLAISDNFSGGYAVGNMNTWPEDGRAYCTTKVYASVAGTYKMTVAYAGGEENHPCTIDVRANDGEWQSIDATEVTSWDITTTIESTIELQEGVNTIDVTGACNIWYSGMSWEWVNLDYFELEKTDDELGEGDIKKTGVELENENLISFRGRNMDSEDAVTFDYSGSGFEFIYVGEGSIKANITTTGSDEIAVDVDETVTYYPINSTTKTIWLAEDLENGTHTIKVYKTKEAMTSLAQLNYLIYDADAEISPIETDYNFLILGASSTCGSQMDPDTGNQNGYLAFPSLVSRAYNATWQQISVSGRGCTQGTLGESNWSFSQENQIADLYTYQSWFRDKTTMFDTTSYVPDVIITNFNNDFSANALSSGYSMDEVFELIMDFIAELRETYPNAYIVMTYGNYPNYDSDGVYSDYTVIDEYEEAVKGYMAESGDDKIAFVRIPCLVNGQSSHPSEDEHTYIAELISGQISEFLGVENPLYVSHFEIESGTLNNAGDSGQVTNITTWASKFSDNSYVEGMNVNLGDEEIAEDGSNVKYISVPVTVEESGTYTVELNYATDGSPDVYMRTNDKEWTKVSLASTGSWATVGQNTEYTVYLKAGENIIDVTGATSGSYVCLDRIDLTLVSAYEKEEEETTEVAEETTEVTEETTEVTEETTEVAEETTEVTEETTEVTEETTEVAEETTEVTEKTTDITKETTIAAESVTEPAKAKIKSAKKKASAKKLKLKIKSPKQVAGYQVKAYKSKRKAKKNKKAIFKKNVTKLKVTVKSKKLKNKKKLFVRVRAYVQDSNGNKIYGKWSKVKKVKIKK